MTVFQAYCSNIADPSIWRFVLTFPNSDVADEWWRAISDTPSIASLFTRATTQFYTHDASSFNIMNFFTDSRTNQFASDFKGKLFITLINDQVGREIPIIKSLNVANAISGNWFFIRSTADHNLYWYFDPTTTGHNITVSAIGRTAFCINAVNKDNAGKVLINADPVTLQVEWTTWNVNVNNAKDLFAGVDAHKFLLGDLKNKIRYMPNFDYLKDKSDLSIDSGWKWELVE